MKAKQQMMVLTISFFFISACNQPSPPDVEGDVQGEAHAQYELENKQAPDYNLALNGSEKNVRALNHSGETERDDELLIENVIYDMPEVTPSMVNIIGERAWVYVSFERTLTPEEVAEQKAFIESELTKKNPRYEYEIKIYGATESIGRNNSH